MTTTARRVPYAYLPTELRRGSELRVEIERGWGELLDEGDFTLGKRVEAFESDFAAAVGAPYAVGVRSGTDALALALLTCQSLTAGARVAVPVNSFYASVGAILQAGMRPVLVDVGPDMLIDQRLVRRLIEQEAIDAIMPVHWTGAPAVVDPAPEGIPIIYDAAQAVGATWRGRPIGALGTAVCYSLHPLKNIHACGDGGVVTTRDEAMAIWISRLRNHGLINRDTWLTPGFNARLEPVMAVAARASLKRLDWITARRRENAAYYDQALADIPQVKVSPRDPLGQSAFHVYMVMAEDRDNLVHTLLTQEIEAKVHYPRILAEQPALSYLGYKPGDYPVAEAQAKRIVSLPIHEHLSREDQDAVVAAIRAFYAR